MVNDPYSKRLLWFIFTATRGGMNRLKLVLIIKEKSLNANQLAKEMGIDYKAIQHHINVLLKNGVISRMGEKYGATYFISPFLEANMETFNQIATEMDKSK
jgi:predicted transcriptional regulator